jgi:hypothetical protein
MTSYKGNNLGTQTMSEKVHYHNAAKSTGAGIIRMQRTLCHRDGVAERGTGFKKLFIVTNVIDDVTCSVCEKRIREVRVARAARKAS